MDFGVFLVLLFISLGIWWGVGDICLAIRDAGERMRPPDEITVRLADDDCKEDLLWSAWELMAEVNPPLCCDWNKKFAAWEREYFGQDEDCDE